MEEFKKIPKPIGSVILRLIPPEKEVQGPNGIYYHYADVCTLLKKYRQELLTDFCEYIFRYEQDHNGGIFEDERDPSEYVNDFIDN